MAKLNPKGDVATWAQTCLRVAINAAYVYHDPNKTTKKTAEIEEAKIDAFYNIMSELVFIPDVLNTDQSNIEESVVTDAFIQAVVDNEDSAREQLYAIAEQIWATGSPKILFTDRIDEDNMVKYLDNPCVGGDTLIMTVNEGARPIKELAEEGYDVLVYTWNSGTKLPEVGIMHDIRLTREDQAILEIEFDSGLKVLCTPDHNFYAIRGKKVEAQNLKIGTSVRAYKGEVHRDGHVRIHGWAKGKVKHQYTARMVYEYFHGEIPEKHIIHHRNMIENDNNPENLEALTVSIHNSIHFAERRRSGFGNHRVVSVEEAGRADVYNGMVDGTHAYVIADPGSTIDFFTGIVSANCGETSFGSINLHKVYDTKAKDVNWEFLEYIVRNAVTFLDSVQEISGDAKELRRIGLGVMGWADLLAELKISYSSDEALALARNVSWFITYFAYLQSMTLAQEHGTFELYDPEKVDLRTVNRILNCPEFAPRAIDIDEVRQLGFRNVAVTNITSTGSSAIRAGVTSGIEPFQEITPDWHIKMQADWQIFVDGAISKIINLPEKSKVVDIYEAIGTMWVANLKGGTIQILNTGVK
jgi:ribonucleotide reductase alpha subunit